MKAAALLIFLLSYPFFGHDPGNTRSPLVYFNEPESVRHPGIVGEADLPAGQPARIFFHFVNRTRAPQKFQLVLDRPLLESTSGIAIHRDPGEAGSLAVRIYWNKKLSNVRVSSDIFTQLVPAGDTVSGVVDGTPKEIAHVVCSMGKGSTNDWRVGGNVIEVWRKTTLGKSLLLGDDSGPIKGAYGTMHHLQFANSEQTSRTVAVYVSPRGGAARFVYLYKNALHTTPLISAKCAVLLFKDTVPAHGILSLDSLPIGGYSYPCKISVKFAR